jgi:hypothetical protein
MKNIPKTIISPLLAQAKLLGSDISKFVSSKTATNSMSDITQIPTFHQIKEVEEYTGDGQAVSDLVVYSNGVTDKPQFFTAKPYLPEITPELRATLSRLEAEFHNKLKPHQIAVKEKAMEYGIDTAINIEDLAKAQWSKLSEDVYQWEDMLEVALDLNIEWNESNYDPVALEQEIENVKHEAWQEVNTMRTEYCADLV